MNRFLALALAVAIVFPAAAEAAPVYACGGAALAGGAQLLCSHINPTAPPQSCNFSWALMTTDDRTSVVQGAFLLEPGTSNTVVYQGFGFNSALSSPIVICEGQPR